MATVFQNDMSESLNRIESKAYISIWLKIAEFKIIEIMKKSITYREQNKR